jgi:NADPH-dependent 2,4-dienoyl-CoA reductase/sulfur reductase-like enzyme
MKRAFLETLLALVTCSLLTACTSFWGGERRETQVSPGVTPVQSAAQPTLGKPADTPTPAFTPTPTEVFVPLSLSAADCSYGGELQSIQALDPHTVRFTLCSPDPAFLSKIAFPAFAIYPQDWLSSLDTLDPTQPPLSNPPGSGPYQLADWRRGESLTMQAFENYWQVGKPAIPSLSFRWNLDSGERLVELQAGTAQGIDNVAGADYPSVQSDPGLALVPRPPLSVLYMGMNSTQAPFDDPRVRQAIAMGIDRSLLKENLPLGFQVADYFTPCAIPDACEGEAWYTFDPAQARQLLADPELPNKLTQSRREDIRPCIHCYTCVGQIFINEVVKCAVNPACARETEFEITPAAKPKRVLVVGGGTSGMEAARVAALRGHQVTLCEKSERLGGTLWFASLVYEPNGQLLDYLEAQVRKLPIEVRLGQDVTPALVQQLRPDVILVAVGARRERIPIPGVDRPNVFSGDDLRSLMTGGDKRVAAEKLSLAQRAVLKMGSLIGVADRVALSRELSRHWMPLGKRVAVIGGGLVGLELAEFLVERDREVGVIEEDPTPGAEMGIPRRWRVLHILREHGVNLLTEARVEAITDAGVVYVKDGKQQTVAADSVILASGVQENRGLAEALAGLGAEMHLLGDCKGVGYIEGALLDANRIARQI